MSIEDQEKQLRWLAILERIVPLKDLPFIALTEDESKTTATIFEEIRIEVVRLSKEAEAAGQIRPGYHEFYREVDGKQLHISGSHFIGMRSFYQDSDLLIEIWNEDMRDHEREDSYSFFPDKVINRPNHWGGDWVVNSDGIKTIQLDDNGHPEEKPNYQVGANELNELLDKMKRSTPLDWRSVYGE